MKIYDLIDKLMINKSIYSLFFLQNIELNIT